MAGTSAILADPSPTELSELVSSFNGPMKRLIVHQDPRPVAGEGFMLASGEDGAIDDFRGTVLVVNFWATWCGPCVKEMPSLDRLQGHFDKEDVLVLGVATGRNPPAKVEAFLEENGIASMTIAYDPKASFSGANSVISIPVTVIADQQGNEVARFLGDTEWDSEEAVELLRWLAGTSGAD